MKKALTVIAIVAHAYMIQAQNVGIGNADFVPNTSAVLDLNSTTSGFLMPRMTQAQMTAISSPAEGLIVYQTNATTGFKYFDGTVWLPFGGGADNFGTHEAETNIEMSDFWISNDGGNEGIRISNAGNIGIGISSPTAELHTSGTVRMEGLSGSGTRMVVADANGNLSTQNITSVVANALDEITRAVSSSSSESTSSTSNVDLNGMTLLVEPGRYIFQFNCDMEVNNGNTIGEFSFNVNGSTVSESIRRIKPGTNSPGIATLITVVDVPSSGTLKVQFRRNSGSGTVTVGGRTLMVMKISI